MTRLMDYLIVVGNKKPVLDSPQAPELLRCFPEVLHEDFPLPIDVVFFCQPEGCISASKRLSLKDTNSFVFTLTEKDSGIVRYGMCCNFFRPCVGLRQSSNCENINNGDVTNENGLGEGNYKDSVDNEWNEKTLNGCSFKSVPCRSLTSICIISINPFLSTFRECLFVLRKIIESRVSEPISLDKLSQYWHVVTEGNVMKYVPNPTMRNWTMFLDPNFYKNQPQIKEIHEIEQWIMRLTKMPLPTAGENRIEVELLPRHLQPPLTFALPEKSRFSLLDFPLHLPFELLGVETCLKVLTCILLERKVLLQSEDYNALSISVMALKSMLYPMEYMFPVIPLLPTCMKNAEQLLLAPTPYIIGIPTSFLQYKSQYFQVPADILIVDLDTSKLSVPLSMDEIPSFPEPEGTILREQLRQCIDCLSLYPQSMPSDYSESGSLKSHHSSASGAPINDFIYGNDIDSIDVAIRACLVKFFTSPSVNGDFAQYCRILRLYPRPLVAFQRDAFVASRHMPSDFINALAETQALEYFGEWLVNPDNTVFRKVYNGILNPKIIGDKPRWYSHYLDPIYYQVHNPCSKLGHDLCDDSDDSGPLFDYEDDLSDSDVSLEEAEELMRQFMKKDFGEDVNETAVHNKEKIAEMYDSSYSSYSPQETEDKSDVALRVISYPVMKAQPHIFNKPAERQENTSTGPEDCNVSASTLQAILDSSRGNSIDENGDDKEAGTQTDERFFKRNSLSRTSSLGQKAKEALTRQGSNASERITALIDQFKPRLSQKSSVDSQISAASFTSSGSSECNSVPTSPLTSRSLSQPHSISEVEDGSTLRWTNPEKLFERSSFTTQRSLKDPKIHTSDNQQVLNDVVTSVLKGDGVGWFSQKKLRRLLVHESLRQYLFKQLYEPKELTEDDETIANFHISRNGYRSILELLRFVIEGLQQSMLTKGAGGLASVFSLLEVMHTHYCGKKIQESPVVSRKSPTAVTSTKRRDSDKLAQLSYAIDAKSDSSIVYTREASPMPQSDERVSAIFGRREDHNDNTVTAVNGADGKRGSLGSTGGHSESSLNGGARGWPKQRGSIDAGFEAASSGSRRSSLFQHSSPMHSGDEDLAGMGTLRRLPSLNHSSLTSKFTSSSPKVSKSVGEPSLAEDVKKDSAEERSLVCKSNASNGYRFRCNALHEARKERVSQGITGTGRRFVFEGLMNPRSIIWDNLSFWEYCFYDAVAAEREVIGMDVGPVELLDRYRSLGRSERRCVVEDEDRILASILHNMIAFMLTVQVDKTMIRRKVRRLLGKAHIGLVYTQHINILLDNLDRLNGNDIDLKPLRSRTMKKHVFVVHLGDDQSGPVFFLEVCDDCMLIKSTNGGIVERWWYENVVNMSCSPRARILCLWVKLDEETELQKISTKKCKSLYSSIKESMVKTARKFKGLEPGMELGGEFDVVDCQTNQKGLLRVSLDGVSIIFIDRKCTIDVRNLKNCSRKEDTLYIEEYVPHTQQVIQHELFSKKAGDICYSVLCLFSYLAAANNSGQSEARGSEGASSH